MIPSLSQAKREGSIPSMIPSFRLKREAYGHIPQGTPYLGKHTGIYHPGYTYIGRHTGIYHPGAHIGRHTGIYHLLHTYTGRHTGIYTTVSLPGCVYRGIPLL